MQRLFDCSVAFGRKTVPSADKCDVEQLRFDDSAAFGRQSVPSWLQCDVEQFRFDGSAGQCDTGEVADWRSYIVMSKRPELASI